MKDINSIPSPLKSYIPIIKGLGQTLGKHFEIVLHDITNKEKSIVAIANGHITKRKVGAPVTDLLMEMIHKANNNNDQKLNYTTQNKNGKPLKSSTFLIRNKENEIVGAICINIDLTSIKIANDFINEISQIQINNNTSEYFPENTDDFLDYTINKGMEKLDKPVHLTDKEEKVQVVTYLVNNNVFNIKGAVDIVAQKLNVSRYTIYNYIDEVKAKEIHR